MLNKSNVALLSVTSNSLLVALKIVAGIASGSVSILSEAIHSVMDLLAAIVAFAAVRLSARPADTNHPYGHEKYENVSGVIEGMLILAAAGWIIYESILKLIHPHEVSALPLALGVMFLSSVVNLIVSTLLYRVARESESVALEADALHLRADVITSAGVGAGLLALWLTGWTLLDPLAAILVALFIIKEAVELIRKAFAPLLDGSLSPADMHKVEQVLARFSGEYLSLHDLRTRQAGHIRHIDLHLLLPREIHLHEAHALCDRIEAAMQSELPEASILIHPECCDRPCPPGQSCSAECVRSSH